MKPVNIDTFSGMLIGIVVGGLLVILILFLRGEDTYHFKRGYQQGQLELYADAIQAVVVMDGDSARIELRYIGKE